MDAMPLIISFLALLLASTALLILRDVRRELTGIGEAAAKGVNTRADVRALCGEMEDVLEKWYHAESRQRMREKRAKQAQEGPAQEEELSEADQLAQLIAIGTQRLGKQA